MNWIDASELPPLGLYVDAKFREGKKKSAGLIVIVQPPDSLPRLVDDVRYMEWPMRKGYMVRNGKGWKLLKNVTHYTYLRDLPLPDGVDDLFIRLDHPEMCNPISKDFKL